jgi:hypothetical protein
VNGKQLRSALGDYFLEQSTMSRGEVLYLTFSATLISACIALLCVIR